MGPDTYHFQEEAGRLQGLGVGGRPPGAYEVFSLKKRCSGPDNHLSVMIRTDLMVQLSHDPRGSFSLWVISESPITAMSRKVGHILYFPVRIFQ